MKKNLSKVLVVLLSIFTFLNFISCSNNTDDDTPGFTIQMPGSARALVDNVEYYELIIQEVDGIYTDTKKAIPGEVVEFSNLKICEYLIMVSAFDSTDKKIAYGEKNAVPLPKNYEKINFQKLLNDFGIEIAFDIDWDSITNNVEIILHRVTE